MAGLIGEPLSKASEKILIREEINLIASPTEQHRNERTLAYGFIQAILPKGEDAEHGVTGDIPRAHHITEHIQIACVLSLLLQRGSR